MADKIRVLLNEEEVDRTSEDVQKRKKYNLNVYEECSREEYEDSIRRLKDYITEGDVYVANMTRHIVVDSEKKPLDVFRDLRVSNPSPLDRKSVV